ncbi:thioredoxin [Rudaea sp.]|uniref:thioredoxin n=1 Tax=Rudaea sp. TaxID=2136325 RepID=UPI002ED4196A
MSAVNLATDADFATQVLQSATPVLVDFWGEWCAPCKMIAPMLEGVAHDYAGKVKVVKVNIDENQRTAIAWRVRSAPTLMLFKNGVVAATQIGAVSKSQLVQMVERAL